MKFEEIFETLGAQDFKNIAIEKTDEITKGIKSVVKQIKGLDLNGYQPVVDSIKDNINNAITKVQDIEVVEYAKGKVVDTKNQVFSMLNIPSQVEVDNLNRKLANLEKKIKTISKNGRGAH